MKTLLDEDLWKCSWWAWNQNCDIYKKRKLVLTENIQLIITKKWWTIEQTSFCIDTISSNPTKSKLNLVPSGAPRPIWARQGPIHILQKIFFWPLLVIRAYWNPRSRQGPGLGDLASHDAHGLYWLSLLIAYGQSAFEDFLHCTYNQIIFFKQKSHFDLSTCLNVNKKKKEG